MFHTSLVKKTLKHKQFENSSQNVLSRTKPERQLTWERRTHNGTLIHLSPKGQTTNNNKNTTILRKTNSSSLKKTNLARSPSIEIFKIYLAINQ
jgi:hypothetical protein